MTVEGGSGNAELSGDVRCRNIGVGEHCAGEFEFSRVELGRASEGFTGVAGGLKACECTFPDEGSLKLGESGADMEEGAAVGSGGVECFGE